MFPEKVLERRLKPRISVSFPVVLRGINEEGQKYEECGTLKNISASGLYLCTNKYLQIGDRVFLAIQFSSSRGEDVLKKKFLMALGNVVRVDYLANPNYGVAMKIDHYRFT